MQKKKRKRKKKKEKKKGKISAMQENMRWVYKKASKEEMK